MAGTTSTAIFLLREGANSIAIGMNFLTPYATWCCAVPLDPFMYSAIDLYLLYLFHALILGQTPSYQAWHYHASTDTMHPCYSPGVVFTPPRNTRSFTKHTSTSPMTINTDEIMNIR